MSRWRTLQSQQWWAAWTTCHIMSRASGLVSQPLLRLQNLYRRMQRLGYFRTKMKQLDISNHFSSSTTLPQQGSIDTISINATFRGRLSVSPGYIHLGLHGYCVRYVWSMIARLKALVRKVWFTYNGDVFIVGRLDHKFDSDLFTNKKNKVSKYLICTNRFQINSTVTTLGVSKGRLSVKVIH